MLQWMTPYLLPCAYGQDSMNAVIADNKREEEMTLGEARLGESRGNRSRELDRDQIGYKYMKFSENNTMLITETIENKIPSNYIHVKGCASIIILIIY